MRGAFEDITLVWDDQTYTVKSHNVMRAIARIEDVVTMAELAQFASRGVAPLAKLSLAYASLLQFAGCVNATAEDVYNRMFSGAQTDEVTQAVQGLLLMMVPPNLKVKAGDVKAGKPLAADPKTTSAAATSKKRTKSQSAKANGSPQLNSGS